MSTASNKRRWADPEYRAKMLARLDAARNKPEHPFDKAVRVYRISKARQLKVNK
jgi:hypothetical protein